MFPLISTLVGDDVSTTIPGWSFGVMVIACAQLMESHILHNPALQSATSMQHAIAVV